MDQQLKSRLIGATVLVVLAVLLVPELLSGRKADTVAAPEGQTRGTRTYTIDLGGGITEDTARAPQAAPSRPQATPAEPVARQAAPEVAPEPVVEAPEPAPTTTAGSAAPAPESRPQAAAPAQPAVETPPQPEPAVAAAAGGRFSVQVGAFGSTEAARRLVADLRRDGYPAYVAPLQKQGKTLHRVRVGPAASREEADRLAARLKGKGLPATVVAGG
jgi:DedD protein